MDSPDNTGQLPLPLLSSIAKNTLLATEKAAAVCSNNKPKRSILWYALYFPQLGELDTTRQEASLNDLARLAQNVSSTISLHPLALVCEIRSSLKYFSGIDAIHDRLQQPISDQLAKWNLPRHFLYAASPTVTGSLLLARSGLNLLVYQKDSLRSALGQLPTTVLELDKEQRRRLCNMGIRHLRDLWRLPGDGLRKRFGSRFVNRLDQALGRAPEPTRNYLPPPTFTTSYDFPYELEDLNRLLPVADEMLAQLCDFLRRRDLSTSQLLFSLLHEKQQCTEVDIGLRQASRCQRHLMLLLETHFSNLQIPAPVITIKVEVKKFDAFMGHSESLLLEESTEAGHGGKHYRSLHNNLHKDNNLDQLIEQLQARLGDHRVKSISSMAEHCPEYASQQPDCHQAAAEKLNTDQRNQMRQKQGIASQTTASNPRPFWLLQEPKQLFIRRGRLYHRKPVSIISGPERIETYWWSGTDMCRDYYIAQENNGSRLWIYRERTDERNWYLHGVFA